jgi:hypothetical protein
MSSPKHPAVPHIEVPNPAEAFRKLEHFTRQILAVPKKEIDRKLKKERADKKNDSKAR